MKYGGYRHGCDDPQAEIDTTHAQLRVLKEQQNPHPQAIKDLEAKIRALTAQIEQSLRDEEEASAA